MPDILKRAGEALYGPRWQTYIAKDLGVSDRTVRRWIAGENPIPDDAYKILDRIISRRIAALNKLLA